jgi:CBS domain-containing protein
MLRRRLSEILTRNVVNVSPTTSVSEVIQTMHSKNISCIVVVEANKPIGIFTERNVVQVLAERGPDFDGREIRELMSSPVLTANQNVEVHIAYNLLVTHKIRRLVVVDDEGSVVGVITQSNLIEHLGYEYFIEIKKVSQKKKKILFTISKDMTVPQALRGMARESLSCLVIAQDDRPVGILTERDVARLSVDRGDIWKLKVEQVMSSPVHTLSQQTPVHEAAKIMQKKNVRRVVVVDMDGKIVGLITQSDIVKGLEGKYIETLKEVIKEKDVKIESTSRDLAEKTVYLDNILHSSVDIGIVATDLNFRIAYFNPGAEKILGYAAQEVIGRNAREIHRQEGVELSRFDKVIEAIPKNKTHAFSF